MKKKYYIFFFLCLLALSGFAQEINVTGVVTEASTKEPMPGVTIQVKGTDKGTISDMDGKYTIVVKQNDILVFSTIGMKSIEKTITSNAPINVAMEEDNVALEQVVVIGYGTVKKATSPAPLVLWEPKNCVVKLVPALPLRYKGKCRV